MFVLTELVVSGTLCTQTGSVVSKERLVDHL